jgi:hypothetical protein
VRQDRDFDARRIHVGQAGIVKIEEPAVNLRHSLGIYVIGDLASEVGRDEMVLEAYLPAHADHLPDRRRMI